MNCVGFFFFIIFFVGLSLENVDGFSEFKVSLEVGISLIFMKEEHGISLISMLKGMSNF